MAGHSEFAPAPVCNWRKIREYQRKAAARILRLAHLPANTAARCRWGAHLDAIERAIRSALDRGNAADQQFREKVYRQAFAALERALQANPSLTVETAIRRRKGLQTKITEIEAAYLPVAPRSVDPALSDLERELGIDPVVSPAPVVETPMAAAPPIRPAPRPEPPLRAPHPRPESVRSAPRVEPAVLSPRYEPGGQIEPSFDDFDAGGMPVSDEIVVEADGPTPHVPDIMVETEPELPPIVEPVSYAEARPSRRGRRWVRLLMSLTLLSILAIGGYMAYQMGLLGGNAARQQELADARPVPTPETEDFEPGADAPPAAPGQADPQRTWINVFTASDPSTVSAPGDAKAEAMRDPAGDFIRLTSGASGSAILFDVREGVLARIAGKRATFNIVARAVDDKDTEMSVACNFGELGDCGRKRYAVGNTRADYLFDIDVPSADPGAGGTIAINSDFANTGKSVDIFEIKVSAEPIPASN